MCILPGMSLVNVVTMNIYRLTEKKVKMSRMLFVELATFR